MASGNPGRGGHSWQPAAPTSMQMTGAGRGGQQQPPQQHQMQAGQQPMPMAYHGGGRGGRGGPQGGRGGNNAPPNAFVVGMPPPQMNPYYHNPYAQHMPPPQYNPQAGRGGTHGWNPSYPGAPVVSGNPYAGAPQQFYQGGPGRGAGRGGPRGGRGGRGAGRGHTQSSYTPPAPRVKKALVITVRL